MVDEELFLHKSDPLETDNVAESSFHLKRARELLLDHWPLWSKIDMFDAPRAKRKSFVEQHTTRKCEQAIARCGAAAEPLFGVVGNFSNRQLQ